MMEPKSMTPAGYVLMLVHVGPHAIHARPTHWNSMDEDGFGNDLEGNPIRATNWHATCPECAQLIEFDEDNIFIDGVDLHIVCGECQMGSDTTENMMKLPKTEDTPKIEKEPEPKEEILGSWLPQSKTTTNMFLDPIASGKMEVELNTEMLNIL